MTSLFSKTTITIMTKTRPYKQILIISFLLSSQLTIGFAQDIMRLDRYIVTSCQLDSIINMVLDDVEEGEIVGVSVKKNGNDNYMLFFSAFSPKDLSYSSRIMGYIQKYKITILLDSSVKEFVAKHPINYKLKVKCIPPPSKGRRQITVRGTDGVKEWCYSLIDGRIILESKILKW